MLKSAPRANNLLKSFQRLPVHVLQEPLNSLGEQLPDALSVIL